MTIRQRILIYSVALGGFIAAPLMPHPQAHVADGQPHQHEDDTFMILYHGILPPDKAEMMMRTKRLANMAKTHHLLVICTSSNDIPRAGRESHIVKSPLYPITGGEMRIETTLTKEFLRFSNQQSRTMLTCFPAIIPKTVPSEALRTLDSVYRSGGKFVQGGVRIRADSLFKAVTGSK